MPRVLDTLSLVSGPLCGVPVGRALFMSLFSWTSCFLFLVSRRRRTAIASAGGFSPITPSLVKSDPSYPIF